MTKNKTLEAILVIVIGFLILFLIYKQIYFLYISLGFGIVGIINEPLARLISKGWYKLGELMGFIVSKIVLTIVFFFLLVPIALLYKIFNNDTLKLKRTTDTLWFDRNHKYSSSDFKNPW